MRRTMNPTMMSGAVPMPVTPTQATGGRDLPPPKVVHRKVQVRVTDDPRTDRWVKLSTAWRPEQSRHVYTVGVVDGLDRPTRPPTDHSDLAEARRTANRIHRRMAREDN